VEDGVGHCVSVFVEAPKSEEVCDGVGHCVSVFVEAPKSEEVEYRLNWLGGTT